MEDIIKEIQEEINNIMNSKTARKSDKQLEYLSIHETSYETVMEMYQLHLSGMSVTQIAKKYGYKNSEKITEKFDRHDLKYKKMNSRHGNPKAKKSIEQYSLNGKYIQTFESLLMASESSNVKVCSISLAASGTTKTSGGFIWKYKN